MGAIYYNLYTNKAGTKAPIYLSSMKSGFMYDSASVKN